jgi:hypothetical protein
MLQSSPESKFEAHLSIVALIGNGLRLLSRSAAIESHMRAIEPSLRKLQAQVVTKRDDEQEEPDTELQSVQPSTHRGDQTLPLWMSYLEWLMLMVVHFDAVEIIHGFTSTPTFRDHYQGVSITIASPPYVTKQQLPWEQLLRSTHFPSPTSGEICNEDIIGFLKEGLKKTPVMHTVKKDLGKLLEGDSLELAKFQKIVKKLQRKDFVGDTEIAGIIAEANFAEQNWNLRESRKLVGDIINTLELILTPNLEFFGKLRKTASFEGLEHCEALLATLISLGRTSASQSVHPSLRDVMVELKIKVRRVFSILVHPFDVLRRRMQDLS